MDRPLLPLGLMAVSVAEVAGEWSHAVRGWPLRRGVLDHREREAAVKGAELTAGKGAS